ncbi:hypothetical protein [Meiothermus sp. CFH 77666]|uniref:hypothetical protein n=1 Tax=Meiothermus sp. CFH 77666 TaxID=2817942 RepID=UPI001AA0566E|nr:hypothetical protein [Meiothermus sp. CFH 77666]MBO1438439.1 hypothetical protein [Meiothermus sp. CFH 77666]
MVITLPHYGSSEEELIRLLPQLRVREEATEDSPSIETVLKYFHAKPRGYLIWQALPNHRKQPDYLCKSYGLAWKTVRGQKYWMITEDRYWSILDNYQEMGSRHPMIARVVPERYERRNKLLQLRHLRQWYSIMSESPANYAANHPGVSHTILPRMLLNDPPVRNYDREQKVILLHYDGATSLITPNFAISLPENSFEQIQRKWGTIDPFSILMLATLLGELEPGRIHKHIGQTD